ncbi:hypothetical protein AKG98_1178 [Moritella sp. JT01]|uniref:hypothetical protein n=1 Tax=Moritella sp. JT01 TaxID=756698 RepID=UPI0007975C9C|nr:hypothetical protein [Moritella sp. JT01]KXO09580.1 hypothetical protein AKG98_1178 [Moritella sp. JT01]
MNKIFFTLLFSGLVSYTVQASEMRADTFTKALHFNDKGMSFSDNQLKQIFLESPESDYSELRTDNSWVLNNIAWHNAWEDFQTYYSLSLRPSISYKLLTREAGFTKALPQTFSPQQLNPSPDGNGSSFYNNDPEAVRASVVKAQVDPDIFHHAYQMFSYESQRYSYNIHTIISKLALAVQIVRNKSQRIPQDQWKQNGIRMEVVNRFMNDFYSLQSIWPSDREYLIQVITSTLQVEIMPYESNHDYLRTHYRLARLSSAMVDRYGYIDYPCSSDNHYRGPENTNNKCFVDMTDRSLWSWYSAEYAKAIVPKPAHDYRQTSFLNNLFEILMPIALLMDGLATVEFFTSSSAAEFVADEVWTEEEMALSQESFLTEFCEAEI